MSADVAAYLRVRVGRVVDELLHAVDSLRGAAALIEAQAELRAEADETVLRLVAAGVRAAAMHALGTAADVIDASAKLEAYAGGREVGEV